MNHRPPGHAYWTYLVTGGHRRTQADIVRVAGGLSLRRTLSAADNVRGGLSLSDSGGLRRTLSSGNRTLSAADSGGLRRNWEAKVRGGPSASRRRIRGGSAWVRQSPPKSARVRRKSPRGPPESAKVKSAADSGGFGRTQADPPRTSSANYCAGEGNNGNLTNCVQCDMAWYHQECR